MIFEFKTKINAENTFYDIKILEKEQTNEPCTAYMRNEYILCYINTDKFDKDNCHIFYIQDFYYNEYKNILRKQKLMRILED